MERNIDFQFNMLDYFNNSIGIEFIKIRSGEFLMGSPSTEMTSRNNERPMRKYEINEFYLGVYPVTQSQYSQIMGTNPSYFSENGNGKNSVVGLSTQNFPVDSVSWEEAQNFCDRLSSQPVELLYKIKYRLPTEKEWEYACKSGKMTPFSTGDTFTSYDGNINGLYPYNSEIIGPTLNRTCDIGCYSPNRFGLFDMHGNVWEWCDDEYYTYNTLLPKGNSARILKGGSWNCYSRFCRSSYRCIAEKDVHYYDCGFRIICDIT